MLLPSKTWWSCGTYCGRRSKRKPMQCILAVLSGRLESSVLLPRGRGSKRSRGVPSPYSGIPSSSFGSFVGSFRAHRVYSVGLFLFFPPNHPVYITLNILLLFLFLFIM